MQANRSDRAGAKVRLSRSERNALRRAIVIDLTGIGDTGAYQRRLISEHLIDEAGQVKAACATILLQLDGAVPVEG